MAKLTIEELERKLKEKESKDEEAKRRKDLEKRLEEGTFKGNLKKGMWDLIKEINRPKRKKKR